MTTVTNTVLLPDGSPAVHSTVVVRLIASENPEQEAQGYTTAGEVVGEKRPTVASDGRWTLELPANSTITPAGTVYQVVTQAPGRPRVIDYISVPATGGPYTVRELLTDPPGALPSAPLTAHTALTTNVHGITNTANLVYTNDARLSDQRVPTDGSVTLAKLAFDPATQAELDSHASSEATARAAGDATNASNLTAHTGAASGAHAASAVSLAGVTGLSSTSNVQAALGYLSNVYNVKAYGAVGDGTTDDTAAIQAAITAAMAAGGGVVFIPEGVFRCNSQLTFTNDGASPRAGQAPLAIVGVTTDWSGYLYDPNNRFLQGSVLDLRASTSPAKLYTVGLGLLTIQNIGFVDEGTSTNPFIQTVNTTLKIIDCAFVGNFAKSGATCDQDAIVLGGTGATSGNLSTSAFSGYGTVIERCFFHRIRRAVYGRSRSNAVVVQHNTVSWLSGATSSAAAFEFDGTGTESAGNHLDHNLIEVAGYVYGVKLLNANRNFCLGNYFWDPGGSFVAAYRIEGTSPFNILDPVGIADDTKALSNPSANSVMIRVDKTFQDGLILGGAGDKNFVRPFLATGSETANLWGVYRSSAEATNAGLKVHVVRQDGLAELLGANAALRFATTPGSSTFVGYVGISGSNLALARYAAGTITLSPFAGGIVDVSTGVFRLPRYTTAGRPAATLGSGAAYYDTTLSKPGFSDGTVWRDAAGTAI
jgi:hypothetical protein